MQRAERCPNRLGNVVAPQEMIDKMGTDGLRLWASSIDFRRSCSFRYVTTKMYRKYIVRFATPAVSYFQILYDFDIEKDAVAI